MGSNGLSHPLKNSELDKSFDWTSVVNESITVDYVSSEEQSETVPHQEAEKQKTNSGKPSHQENFHSKELNVASSPHRGLYLAAVVVSCTLYIISY